MKFRPYESSERIVNYFKRYLLTTFSTNDDERNEKLKNALNESGMLCKGPYISLSDSYEKTSTISDLVNDNVLIKETDDLHLLGNRKLYKHQEKAIRSYHKGNNLIITTGTGSGKTKSFIIPIIDSLLREEKDNNGLTPGVRVLVIYPMNALVNDQLKEWGELIRGTKITIGKYTGDTYGQPENTNNDENYIGDRATIESTPPHILITNYAMLERLLILPTTNNIFTCQNKYCWSTIVLDEAHSYNGSLGIEISALLRRLKTRVGREHFRFILTSATLGDENQNEEIKAFGKNLCSEDFVDDGIIRSSYATPQKPDGCVRSNNDYTTWARLIRQEQYGQLCDNLGLPLSESSDGNIKKIEKELYDRVIKDELYWNVRNKLQNDTTGKSIIKEVNDIANALEMNEDDFTDFITVATLAKDAEGYGLFEAKYHMFIKGIDGVYVSLSQNKLVSLRKSDTLYDENGEDFKAYEVSFCNNCFALFIVGQIFTPDKINNSDNIYNVSFLEQFPEADSSYTNPTIYMLDTDDDDTDDNNIDSRIRICSKCGAIGMRCGHDETYASWLYKAREEASDLHKCPCCGASNTHNSILRPFETGDDAAASVIATALYSELPYKTEKIVYEFGNDPVTNEPQRYTHKEHKELKRQFLTFSDNRQRAANFAIKFDETYKNALIKRLMYCVQEKHSEDLKNGVSFEQFAQWLADEFFDKKVFAEEKGNSISQTHLESKARYWLLRELINQKAKNSLTTKGGFCFYIDKDNKHENIDQREADICQVMLDYFIKKGAVKTPSFEHEEIELYRNNELYDGQHAGLSRADFIPEQRRTHPLLRCLNKLYTKTENLTPQDAEERSRNKLNNYWNYWIDENSKLLVRNGNRYRGNRYTVNLDKIKIKKADHLFFCDRCHKYYSVNIDNICLTPQCEGELKEINPDEWFKNDHYFQLYREFTPVPLRVEEHTAQLTPEKAREYQEEFCAETGGINVLSCSTTFEMGVDVGSLQTVFMRNVPPTPANYVQRSGRAGRSAESASYTLTYCKNAPHDYYFFNEPEKMISGSINPPDFNISNKEILYRHIFASALAVFWENNQQYYPTMQIQIREHQATIHPIGMFFREGYDRFKEFIRNRPQALTDYLLKAFPENVIDPNELINYTWYDYFFNGDRKLAERVFKQFNEEIQSLIDYRNNLRTEKRIIEDQADVFYVNAANQNDPNELDRLNREKETLQAKENNVVRSINTIWQKNVLSFLSSHALIPKYGFPTDIVNLNVPSGDENSVELERSLPIAIFEYAPESKIIANKKTFISRYILKPSGFEWTKRWYRICKECGAVTQSDLKENLPTSCSCNRGFNTPPLRYIVPEFGFAAEELKNTTNDYFNKNSRHIISYVGDCEQTLHKVEFSCNLHSLTLTRSKDNKLVIINDQIIRDNDDYRFRICNICGYATRGNETEHNKPNGEQCTGSFDTVKYSLGCELITDVEVLDFDVNLSNYKVAWNVLYALLEGLSKALNIERKEISGCLKKNGNNYGLVLFDTAPGGAGYVRKLENPAVMRQTLQEAYIIVSNCSCDEDTACYNCLCNYYNQIHHKILKRRIVKDFLDSFSTNEQIEDIAIVSETAFDENVDEDTVNQQNVSINYYDVDCSTTCGNWTDVFNELADYASDERDVIERHLVSHANQFEEKEKPLIGGSFSIGEQHNLQFTAAWHSYKLMLFTRTEESSFNALADSEWTGLMIESIDRFEKLLDKLTIDN